MTAAPGSTTTGALDAAQKRRLAEAVTLARRGEVAPARRLCRPLLAVSAVAAEAAHRVLGLALATAGDGAGAARHFRIAAVLDPRRAGGWARLAAVTPAAPHLARALTLDPDRLPWAIALGHALTERGDVGAAIRTYRRAATRRPDPRVLGPLAHLLRRTRRPAEALIWFRRAVLAAPADGAAIWGLLVSLRECCLWGSRLDRWTAALETLVAAGIASPPPLFRMQWPASPAQQQVAARAIAAPLLARRVLVRPAGGHRGRRLRLGYLSASLGEHAVGRSLPDMLERHDRAGFEIHALSLARHPDGPLLRRLRAGIECWHDLADQSVDAAARRVAALGLDLLVDLDNLAGGAPALVATRPAPVIASFFGFAGTSGGLHDYIIADSVVVPARDEPFYDEAPVLLPGSFLPVDTTPPSVDHMPTRAAAGLPGEAVVLAAFHGTMKITPDAFAAWIEIVRRVPSSVLWLIDPGAVARDNLRAEAARLGVAPDRLVFAEAVGHEAHLARHALADLFLDTWPYCAHTTAADALRMGVPLVTRAGTTFASRVAESVLRAAQLPDLVAADASAFVERAAAIAGTPARLAEVRRRLEVARHGAPLFDRVTWMRGLERGYRAIAERTRRGLPPARIDLSGHGPDT